MLTVAIFRLGRLVSVENKKEDMKTLCTLIERGGFSDFLLFGSIADFRCVISQVLSVPMWIRHMNSVRHWMHMIGY